MTADLAHNELAPAEIHVAPETAPAEAPPAGRNARGQFTPGNPGGPGRPPKIEYIEREVIAFMAKAISPELWMQIARTAGLQAAEGNNNARAWLTKVLLTGRLTEAAAADEISLPTDIEMFEVGRQKHPRWIQFVDRQRAARETEESDETGAEETAKTAEAAPIETAQTAPHRPAPASPAPSVPPARTLPVTERVNGFRVTKTSGPQAPLNGDKRQNAAKTAPATAPCPA